MPFFGENRLFFQKKETKTKRKQTKQTEKQKEGLGPGEVANPPKKKTQGETHK